jgi:succinoglycan biosynthesis transport protein ExoP
VEEEIDLREYIEVILRRWKWIGGITLVAVVTAAIVSFFLIAPVYEAKAGVVIVKSKSEITFDPKYRTLSEEELAPLIGNQARRQALEALIKSNSVAAEVVANLGAMLEPEERDVSALLEMVAAEAVGDLIRIKVRGRDPKKLAAIANGRRGQGNLPRSSGSPGQVHGG